MRGRVSYDSFFWLFGHIFLILIGALFITDEGQKLAGNVVGVSVGTSLIATGIAGLVLFLYVRASDSTRQTMRIIDNAGLINVFRSRSMNIRTEYESRLAKAKNIDLIGYGLTAFRQDFGAQFAEWSQRGRVRILLIDPDFPSKENSIADIRDREENHSRGEIRNAVDQFVAQVNGTVGLNHVRFEVKLMKAIPAINLLRLDDEMFWGPYLMGEQSRNTPTLLIRRGGFLFEMLSKHFDATWNSAGS